MNRLETGGWASYPTSSLGFPFATATRQDGSHQLPPEIDSRPTVFHAGLLKDFREGRMPVTMCSEYVLSNIVLPTTSFYDLSYGASD